MGGYGLIRMNVEMLPHAHVYFAPVLAVLGVVNIVYGAFTAFGQTNLKHRLAYSSISHMGFVFITACLLLPIIGIGFYPKLATRTYDVKTVEVALKARDTVTPVIAERGNSFRASLNPFYSPGFVAPTLPQGNSQAMLDR